MFKLSQNCTSGNLLNVLSKGLNNREQRALNEQTSTYENVNAEIPQSSILGPFVIYINNLSDGLSSKGKLFVDDTSLFSVTHYINTSTSELNSELKKISSWTYQWNMSFNPGQNKQAHELIFTRELKKVPHPPLIFNNTNFSRSRSQKHVGIVLDSKLTFKKHYKTVRQNK